MENNAVSQKSWVQRWGKFNFPFTKIDNPLVARLLKMGSCFIFLCSLSVWRTEELSSCWPIFKKSSFLILNFIETWKEVAYWKEYEHLGLSSNCIGVKNKAIEKPLVISPMSIQNTNVNAKAGTPKLILRPPWTQRKECIIRLIHGSWLILPDILLSYSSR